MKKILMVCESFGGGVFAYVSQLCNDLVDDFEIYLAFSIRPQTPNDYEKFLDRRVRLIEIKSFQSGKLDLVKIARSISELREIEKNVCPDIIHMHSSIAGGIGRIAFSGKRSVLVYTPHGYAHILMGKGFIRHFFRLVEKCLGRKKCITLTCCESENQEAKEITKQTAYIETGIDVEMLRIKLDSIKIQESDIFTVCAIGRACTQKRPDLFNSIALSVPEARFIWIGDGELRNELTDVEVTGWKTREEALAIAKSADVYVLCSYGEAVAMSLIENMYMKKLVLVSNTVGNKSVIQNGINGYICDTKNEYAEKIRMAMDKFPYNLTEKAYQDVMERYNTKRMKRLFCEFYNEIEGIK